MSSPMETDDNMEDSGFDSDPKNLYNGLKTSPSKVSLGWDGRFGWVG